ncbi:MAG: hypothetical protein A3F76_14945 [Burkholderiales bacterium RIFCSPLOWO2_12_FULL_65_40]|nr:MAG: hypothetical protein A3F76_14945 [Burkholderiales bacterium RIFCSPLOWO2_12_FULL_65_40]
MKPEIHRGSPWVPENTEPMMTGKGSFGSVEMGGMFSMLKVRREQRPGKCKDPAWFEHPEGKVAHEYQGPMAESARFKAECGQSMRRIQESSNPTEVQVRKPTSHHGH